MIDYLKGSIVKFILNFENALDNKRESIWWWQISSKTLVCLEWGNLTIVHNSFFKISSYQNILINFDLFPKNDKGYFAAYLINNNNNNNVTFIKR